MIYKCVFCCKKYDTKESLYAHMELVHSDLLPGDIPTSQFYYMKTHNNKIGKCIVCGSNTEWNIATEKFSRLCKNPQCKTICREEFKKRMTKKFGTDTLLRDPEFQLKMLRNRKISGTYSFPDGAKLAYTGSYEHDFLQFLDVFLRFPSSDILDAPPEIFEYEYNGKKCFYIMDYYITSLNLMVEIKDGGNNPNMNAKIQSVDKVKEKLKDDVMKSQNKYNYIKITNKQYKLFLDFLIKLKTTNIDNINFKPQYMIGESLDLIEKRLDLYDESKMLLHEDANNDFNDIKFFCSDDNNLCKNKELPDDTVLYHAALKQLKITDSTFVDMIKADSRSTFCWKNLNYAIGWGLYKAMQFVLHPNIRCYFGLTDDQCDKIKLLWDISLYQPICDQYTLNLIRPCVKQIPFFIYSLKASLLKTSVINTLDHKKDILSSSSIETIAINDDMLKKYVNVVETEKFIKYYDDISSDRYKKILRLFIMNTKSTDIASDTIEDKIYDDLNSGKLKVGDNLDSYFNESFNVLCESKLSSKDRAKLKDSDFGIPKLRQYPLNDKRHVLAAIKFFRYISSEHEKELGANINKKIDEFGMRDTVKVTKDNRFYKYFNIAKTNINEKLRFDKTSALEPIYVLLTYTGTAMSKIIKRYTHEPFSHASLSFDSSLNNVYSFGRKDFNTKMGFVKENVHEGIYSEQDDCTYSLYVTFVPANIKKSMMSKVKEFVNSKKQFTFNIAGFCGFLINKPIERENSYFCSEFVDYIFKSVGIDYFGRSSALVKPYDFAKNNEFYHIQKGKLNKYDYKKTDANTKIILNKVINEECEFIEEINTPNYISSKDMELIYSILGEPARQVNWNVDNDGIYCYTRVCRSKSYATVNDIPLEKVRFISSTN